MTTMTMTVITMTMAIMVTMTLKKIYGNITYFAEIKYALGK